MLCLLVKLVERYSDAKRYERHKLDELNVDRLARNLIIFRPTEEAVAKIMAKARLTIPGLTQTEDVFKVMRHNSDSLFGVARKSKFDESAPEAEGFIAMLPLNK